MAAQKIRTGQTTLTGGIDRVIPDTAIAGGVVGESISIKALKGNANVCYIGDAAVAVASGFELDANQSLSLDYLDPQDLFVIGTAGQKVCWIVTTEGS